MIRPRVLTTFSHPNIGTSIGERNSLAWLARFPHWIWSCFLPVLGKFPGRLKLIAEPPSPKRLDARLDLGEIMELVSSQVDGRPVRLHLVTRNGVVDAELVLVHA